MMAVDPEINVVIDLFYGSFRIVKKLLAQKQILEDILWDIRLR